MEAVRSFAGQEHSLTQPGRRTRVQQLNALAEVLGVGGFVLAKSAPCACRASVVAPPLQVIDAPMARQRCVPRHGALDWTDAEIALDLRSLHRIIPGGTAIFAWYLNEFDQPLRRLVHFVRHRQPVGGLR